MTDATLLAVDKRATRRAFERAANTYDKAAVLQVEIGRRLLERLDPIRIHPDWMADIGIGTGRAVDALQKRYPKARLVGLDLAQGMLAQAARHGSWLRRPRLVCADAERLPFARASIDLLFSSCTLQWCNDLTHTFKEFRRVLAPGGLVIFSTFGPDTLKELRASWAAVDGNVHVNRFIDMHDIGDALLDAGFSNPVIEMEMIELTYSEVADLFCDLKNIGAQNRIVTRQRGLTGRRKLGAMYNVYERYRTADGRLPASYEVIYGHAWQLQTAGTVQQDVNDGNVYIPLTSINRLV